MCLFVLIIAISELERKKKVEENAVDIVEKKKEFITMVSKHNLDDGRSKAKPEIDLMREPNHQSDE